MSAQGWPEPKGPVEFVARDLAAALGAQMIPQPVAVCVGGPDDGKVIPNEREFYETPGPPAPYDPNPADPVYVTVTRYLYIAKTERPCFGAEVVTRFEYHPPAV